MVQAVSKTAVMNGYFMVPRRILSTKKGERSPFPPGYCSSRRLLEHGRNVVGVVSFVGLAKVALTAELSRRGRLASGELSLQVRVVRSGHEEIRGIVLAAAVAHDRAILRRSKHGHYVLVVAGPASHVGLPGSGGVWEGKAEAKNRRARRWGGR